MQVLTEEEAFWIFNQIIETIIPIDFFTNMIGGLVDSEIFNSILKTQMPDLWDHFISNGFQPHMCTT